MMCTSKETFLLLLLFFHFNCYLVKNSKTFKPWSTNQTFLVFTLKIFFLFKYRNLENLCRCDATTRAEKKIRSMKMRMFFSFAKFFLQSHRFDILPLENNEKPCKLMHFWVGFLPCLIKWFQLCYLTRKKIWCRIS